MSYIVVYQYSSYSCYSSKIKAQRNNDDDNFDGGQHNSRTNCKFAAAQKNQQLPTLKRSRKACTSFPTATRGWRCCSGEQLPGR